MRPMRAKRIPAAKRALVERLRDRGLSLRQIVEATGVSRSTVARICQEQSEAGERLALPDATRPLGRCPRCGGLVRLPCYACALETADVRRREAWKAQFSALEEE